MVLLRTQAKTGGGLVTPSQHQVLKDRDLGLSCQLTTSLNFSMLEFLFGTMGI